MTRCIHRLARPMLSSLSSISRVNRQFGTSALRLKDHSTPTTDEHRANQSQKPPNQFVPNTTSTMTKDYPNVGDKPAPPEMLNSVDPSYRPADPYPGRIEHFTGGRQDNGAQKPELGVGEMEGITFKVEPLKRTGEDVTTKRARLLCLSPPIHPNQYDILDIYRINRTILTTSRPKPQARNPRVRLAPVHLCRRLPGQDGPRPACRVRPFPGRE
jgi:hypothetical protein